MTAVGALIALGGSLAIAFSTDGMGDYRIQMAPAVDALSHGELSEFFRVQPVYGILTPLLQAPFVALARLGDGSELLDYRLAVLPCLLAVGLIGVQLARVMVRRGQPAYACLAVCALPLVNPATFAAIDNGHPEELLAAALTVAAILAAIDKRTLWAGILLGLALSTKQWAVLAALPVLVASGRGRATQAAVAAGAVVACMALPMAVASPDRFVANARMTEGARVLVSRFSVWWPLSSVEREVVAVGDEARPVIRHRLSRQLTALGRPLIVILALGLALAWGRRRDSTPADALGLLALVFLLRCVLDPNNNAYYHVPFLLSLLGWEVLTRSGLPVLTLVAAAALWGTFESGLLAEPAIDNAFYLGWALAIAGWIALSLHAPGPREKLAARLDPGERVAVAGGPRSIHARK